MNLKGRDNWIYLASIAFAILLQVLPGPLLFMALKPWFLGLVISYYALERPEMIGLGRAFLFGLMADAVSGVMFGEQAFRCCILVYVIFRFRYRMRFFPLWQQTAIIFALFLNDRVLCIWVRWLGGLDFPSVAFWLSPFMAAIIWPWWFVVMDSLRRLSRR